MRNVRWGHALVAAVPAIFIGYFFLYPLARILVLGLSELEWGSDGVEARLLQIGWFTLWQALLSTALTLILAAPMTWAVSQYEFRGRKVATALVTVPFVLPTVVVGTAFVALGWRDSVGAIIAAHVFFNVAVVVRTVGALWARLDPDLHDAGRVLGASEWKVLRTITLPLLRPAIAAAASIVFLFTFTSFGVVLILGGFRYATLEVEIYRQAVTLFDLPLAAALAVVQLVGVTAALYLYSRYQERHAATWALRSEADRPRPEGRARVWVGASVIGTLLALAVPIVILVARSLQPGAYAGLFQDDRVVVRSHRLAHRGRRRGDGVDGDHGTKGQSVPMVRPHLDAATGHVCGHYRLRVHRRSG
jgi:thiamine transport system permease protein